MTEETARWRGSVCILLLFLIVAFFIAGRELLIFTRTFIEVHTSWLPVQGLVQESLIATSERRSSSTRSSAVAHITLFTVGAKVRYTLNDKTYGVTASGWGEYFRRLSEWEQSGVEAGRSISIRVRPDALDHATLLGDWNPASTVVFGRFIAAEIALLCAIVICGKFVIRRSA
jgi:hypothetical protein